MKTSIRIFSLAVLALAMAACSNDMEQPAAIPTAPGNAGEGIPFSATITTGSTTRALTENTENGTILSIWAKGEQVALIHNDVVDVMTIQNDPDQTTGSATITGTLTGSPADGDKVTVVFPASAVDATTKAVKTDLLSAQDGTLATIASSLNLRQSDGVTLKVGKTTATLNGTVKLANQIAIVKFSLTDGTSALAATQFLIKDGSDQVMTTVTPASAASELYVAMAPATTSAFKFEATAASTTYYYNQPSASLAAGTYYQSPMALKDMLHTPLTFEAIEDGTINVTIPDELELAKPVTYTKNGVDYSGGTTSFDIAVAVGDIVTFHSTNAALGKLVNSSYKHPSIKPTNRCYIYGNIMSLIDDAGDFATDKSITGDYALYALFSGADKLENHPAKEILLPATTLTNYCYTELFSGCKALTKAPDLPATELKTRCYEQMFWECTSLTEAPVISATTVASYCCQDMFNGCTSLVKAPDLLATTLAEKCYNGMFKGCSSLSYVQCLATNNIGNDYMNGWLDGVSATGTLEVASTAVWAVAGNNGIPSGWTVIGKVDVNATTAGSQENYDVENTDNW